MKSYKNYFLLKSIITYNLNILLAAYYLGGLQSLLTLFYRYFFILLLRSLVPFLELFNDDFFNERFIGDYD